MKRNLGRVLVVIAALNTVVWGVSHSWNVLESPETLRIGQSGVIRYACTFDGRAAEYSTKLKLVDNPLYSTSILSEKHKVIQGKRIDTIDLLVTPKTSGTVDVRMKAIVRFTPSGAVENTALGRDNLSKIDIVEEEAQLPVVRIRMEKNTAALTGNITMQTRVDRTSVRAHEPVHLSIYIKGTGNLDKFIPFDLNISGVKVFAEPPQKLFSPSSEGYAGEIRQEFALVAEKSYVLAPFTLSLFDTAQNKVKVLQSAPISVEVSAGYEPASLLDTPDPADKSTFQLYALYTVLVAFGVVLGEMARRLWKHRPRRKIKRFWDEAATPKELAVALALSGERGYEEIIAALEANRIGLGEAKKKLSTLTSDNEVKK